MSAATKKLFETYKANIKMRCNLENDPGMMKYLLGESIAQDVTADAYTAVSTSFAQRKMYYVMRCMQMEVMYEQNNKPEEDGTYYIYPESTCSYASAMIDVVLQPGESLELDCMHGCNGVVKVFR